jgi:hypothetical protein
MLIILNADTMREQSPLLIILKPPIPTRLANLFKLFVK